MLTHVFILFCWNKKNAYISYTGTIGNCNLEVDDNCYKVDGIRSTQNTNAKTLYISYNFISISLLRTLLKKVLRSMIAFYGIAYTEP